MGRPRKTTPASAYVPKKISALEGSFDIITQTNALWDALLKQLNRTARVYGFARIEPPVLEDQHLNENFFRSGFAENRPLTVESLGRTLALRYSFLPSVLRAYYQHKIFDIAPLSKWAYSGPVVKAASTGKSLIFDYEFGFEVFGNFSHLNEAQAISAVWEFLQVLGLKDLSLEINNLGQAECQAQYQETLLDFLSAKKYQLCDNCNEHLKGRVLNVFRCGNLDCQAIISEAPTILDFLDQDSHKHFTNILEALDELSIPYQLNHLYAGPEGHSRTNVVIKYKLKGETKVLGEGGYHEGLMENLCGKNYCCFGFAGSLKAVYDLLNFSKTDISYLQKNDVFLVPLGELAAKKSLRLFKDLTREKVSVYDHFGQGGVKNQLKAAETFKAPIALIMGQKEAMEEMVILRDVKSGMQEIISYDKIVEEVKKRLGK